MQIFTYLIIELTNIFRTFAPDFSTLLTRKLAFCRDFAWKSCVGSTHAGLASSEAVKGVG